MKKMLIIVICTMEWAAAAAQVTILPQIPPAGIYQKTQLWNVFVTSAYETPVQARITLRLLNTGTNQPVLTAVSRPLTLQRGARQLQAADLMPIQYEYLSPSVDRGEPGFLGAGSYTVCYSMTVEFEKNMGQREDCFPFAVEPVSPPLLNLPENNAVLETRLPQFSWVPPAPAHMFRDLGYEFLLVEVRPGQSPAEAVQQNIPITTRRMMRDVFLNYPSSIAPLDTGKLYAWHVLAYNGQQFAAQSETWSFRVREPLPKPQQHQSQAFVQLRRDVDGAVIQVSGALQAGYLHETGDSAVHYEILDQENGNAVVESGRLRVQRGMNQLEIRPVQRGAWKAGRLHLFRIRNARNEWWQIRFLPVTKH